MFRHACAMGARGHRLEARSGGTNQASVFLWRKVKNRRRELLDHLVGAGEKRLWLVKAERLCGPNVSTSSNFVGCSTGRSVTTARRMTSGGKRWRE
jgi:hypothetical protein